MTFRRRYRPSRVAAAVLAAIALLGCLSGCAAQPTRSAAERTGEAAPSLPTPMATSVATARGSWATLPLGRLDEPLNTFWQLLYRPTGSARWSNHVKATATATNGGLVLASPGTSRLVVGIRPSSYLTFTPLIATTDGSASWSTGLLDARLAARPHALAVNAEGDVLALVARTGGDRVEAGDGDLSTWTTLATRHSLQTIGRSCRLHELTAVGYRVQQALVGGSCGRAGTVGLFGRTGGTWRPVGPTLPASLARGQTEVLAIQNGSQQVDVLLAVVESGRTSLLVARSRSTGAWRLSPPLAVPAGATLLSYGPATGSGLFVLLRSASGRPKAVVAGPSPLSWTPLASPPAGTATLAFGPSSVDAFVGAGSTLTVWSLDQRGRRWRVEQAMKIPIQYGSSSQ